MFWLRFIVLQLQTTVRRGNELIHWTPTCNFFVAIQLPDAVSNKNILNYMRCNFPSQYMTELERHGGH